MSDLPVNLLPSETSPDWLNKGDNAWQLTAATLVGLQSVPGLVILYGSIVKRKWGVNSAFMAFYAFASVLVCWVGWGYQLSFGDKLLPFWGKPNVALDQKYLLAQGFVGTFPAATLIFFQFVFAGITPVLLAGALVGRMNFKAWMAFVPLWHTFSYTVGAFSLWTPKGFLFESGVIDFAGGYVIHLSSGISGLTAAYWVKKKNFQICRKYIVVYMLIVFFFFVYMLIEIYDGDLAWNVHRWDQEQPRTGKGSHQTTFS